MTLLTFFYNSALFALMLIFFPKLFWQCIFHGKYRKSFFSRIQPLHPNTYERNPIIWLHGVSVGEMKALATLLPHIRKTYPYAFILISSVTETGQTEAKKSMKEADAFCYLPLDFSWIIDSFVKRLRPDLLILVEGDFWFNLLNSVKKIGGSIALVNGKISEQSFKRYLFLKSFSRMLFQKIDIFCVQSEEYMKRFLTLGIESKNITVIGNLKYDIPHPNIFACKGEISRERLGLQKEDFILTVGSTHHKEEELILEVLKPFWRQYKQLKILLVPRHPERFCKVAKIIEKKGIPYTRYSSLTMSKGQEKVILIDQMGILPLCYQVSHLSIVGGSFVKDIGGHDIFEPAKIGIPVLFGPYMHKQKELSKNLLKSGAAKQITINQLSFTLEKYLSTPSLMKIDGEKGKQFAQEVMGSSFRTWTRVKQYITFS